MTNGAAVKGPELPAGPLPTPTRGDHSGCPTVKPAAATQRHLDTPQMRAATGLTYRQLAYWSRHGNLRTIGTPTPGSGTPRIYPTTEVVIARRMRALTTLGVQPGEAARIARGGWCAAGVQVVFDDAQLAQETT